MKKFKDFINEEVDLTANVDRGVVDIHDNAVVNNINGYLNTATACSCVTPYVAIGKVHKVLANFHIFLPKAPYMEDEQGVQVFPIKQFGRLAGMRNDGSVVTRVDSPYSLYFEWKRNERGMYDIFAEIVDDEELKNLLDAVEEDLQEENIDEGIASTLAKGARFVPGLGTAVSLGLAGYRAAQGDYKGAGLAAASALPGPAGYAALGADLTRGSLWDKDSGETKKPETKTAEAKPTTTTTSPITSTKTPSSAPAKTPSPTSPVSKVPGSNARSFVRPLSRIARAGADALAEEEKKKKQKVLHGYKINDKDEVTTGPFPAKGWKRIKNWSSKEDEEKKKLNEKSYDGTDNPYVQLKTQSGLSYTVHRDYAPRFQGLVKDLEDSGYKIKSIGGYANRNIAGTNRPSHHSHGAAIDINPDTNPMSHKYITDMPDIITKDRIYKKWGLGWGGDWKGKKDTMHFSAGPNEGGAKDWTPPETQPAPAPTIASTTKMADVEMPIQQPSGSIYPETDKEGRPTLGPTTTKPKEDKLKTESYTVNAVVNALNEHLKKKDLKLKTSNAKVLQKDLAAAKTEITDLKRQLKKCE